MSDICPECDKAVEGTEESIYFQKRLYHKTCYKVKCHHCGLEIASDRLVVDERTGDMYHYSCRVCDQCSQPLTAKVHHVAEDIICDECFRASSKKRQMMDSHGRLCVPKSLADMLITSGVVRTPKASPSPSPMGSRRGSRINMRSSGLSGVKRPQLPPRDEDAAKLGPPPAPPGAEATTDAPVAPEEVHDDDAPVLDEDEMVDDEEVDKLRDELEALDWNEDVAKRAPSTWNPHHVAKWIVTTDAAHWYLIFFRAGVDGRQLLDMNNQRLKELGVTRLGDRKRILKQLQWVHDMEEIRDMPHQQLPEWLKMPARPPPGHESDVLEFLLHGGSEATLKKLVTPPSSPRGSPRTTADDANAGSALKAKHESPRGKLQRLESEQSLLAQREAALQRKLAAERQQLEALNRQAEQARDLSADKRAALGDAPRPPVPAEPVPAPPSDPSPRLGGLKSRTDEVERELAEAAERERASAAETERMRRELEALRQRVAADGARDTQRRESEERMRRDTDEMRRKLREAEAESKRQEERLREEKERLAGMAADAEREQAAAEAEGEDPGLAPGAPPHTNVRCPGCRKSLASGRVLRALDRRWHDQCFVCSSCGGDLPDSFQSTDGRPFCDGCYERDHAERCARCSKPIVSRFVRACDAVFCKECFNCHRCGKEFPDGTYFRGGDGKPICEACV